MQWQYFLYVSRSMYKCELELELELENNLFDKKYINVSTGYYKHT